MGGVFLYFILSIASLVASIVLFSIQAEWWVGAMFIVFFVVALIVAIYKLDDETSIISNAIKRKKQAKADSIAKGEFEKTPLNMVPMFIKAYDDRKDMGVGYIKDKAVNNIASVINEITKSWKLVYNETSHLSDSGIKSEDDIKRLIDLALEDMFAMLICNGDSFDDGYSVYLRICEKIKHVSLSKTELRKLNERLLDERGEKGCQTIIFFSSISRSCMKASSYENLVQGFIYFSLLNESVYENEYELIKMYFFDERVGDIFPDTWEQFKKEY